MRFPFQRLLRIPLSGWVGISSPSRSKWPISQRVLTDQSSAMGKLPPGCLLALSSSSLCGLQTYSETEVLGIIPCLLPAVCALQQESHSALPSCSAFEGTVPNTTRSIPSQKVTTAIIKTVINVNT